MPESVKSGTLVVVAGPTAVGKTAISIRLAKTLRAEIVSADSRQFYRELAIGTAKPSPLELALVPHHFIDSHSIAEEYDAASYGEDALRCILQLFERTEYVIVCGGSGLYLRALLDGFDEIPEVDPQIRQSISAEYRSAGLGWLQQQMLEKDPGYYSVLDKNNPHRLIRALEVKIGTGKSIAEFQGKAKREHTFRVIKIGLDLPREELYTRIDNRMDSMISEGLFEEASKFFHLRHLNALQTVGYKEIYGYMEGMYGKEEAIRLLKRNTRHYAKRQLTWFRRDPGYRWFNPSDFEPMLAYIQGVVKNGIK